MYDQREKAKLGLGSIVGGLPPCGNCEEEPVQGGDGDLLYCSPACRAEDEGDEIEG